MTQTRAFSIRAHLRISVCNQEQFRLLIYPYALQMPFRSLSERCWRTLMEATTIPSLSWTCALHISAALLSITCKRPTGRDSVQRPALTKYRKFTWLKRLLMSSIAESYVPRTLQFLNPQPWLISGESHGGLANVHV